MLYSDKENCVRTIEGRLALGAKQDVLVIGRDDPRTGVV